MNIKRKYKVYLVAYTFEEYSYNQISKEYIGETWAVSKLQAQNNMRYRCGNRSYSQLYLDIGNDNAIDYRFEAELA
jgi:hypothetical protein